MFTATRICTTSLCVLTLGLLLSSCVTIEDPHVKKAARSVEWVENYLDKWGTISVSDIVIVEDSGQLALEYEQSTGEYVAKARAGYQGAARRSVETSVAQQSSTQSVFDANQALNAIRSIALDVPGVQLPGPGLSASEAGLTSKLPLENQAQGILSTPKFTAPLALADAPSAISERKALLIGVNDKLTEKILNFMTYPKAKRAGLNVFLGIFNVSVLPGSETRKGYMADVNITFGYAKLNKDHKDYKAQPADEKADKDGKADAKKSPCCSKDDEEESTSKDRFVFGNNKLRPTILALFPSLEAQTLDLRNSEREQFALASMVSSLVAGFGGAKQAEQLSSFARRLEYDSATRSPIPVVSSYSDGWSMGFRIMPAFQALGDPANKRKGSAKILHPYSFPAVALVIVTNEERDCWKYITPHVSTGWIPVGGRGLVHPLFKRPGSLLSQLAHADQVYRAKVEFEKLVEDDQTGFADEILAHHLAALETVFGKDSEITTLPIKAKAVTTKLKISTVSPSVGWKNAETIFLVEGQGFKLASGSEVKGVSVGGIKCDFVVVSDKTLIVAVPARTEGKKDTTGVYITVVTPAAVASSPATVKFTRVAKDVPINPSIDVGRDKGKVTSIVVKGNAQASAGTLLNAIKSILSSENISSRVRVEVDPTP